MEGRQWEQKIECLYLNHKYKTQKRKQECPQTFNLKPSDGDLLPAGSANH